ncbi:WD40 repeat domain-containing protein [Nonomuraea endophytica]|uniref:WD40 repeat domain-containing protein n=1 Tax=Nonomuraea endophytica TaxID=714136 RepID=UPI0037C8B167
MAESMDEPADVAVAPTRRRVRLGFPFAVPGVVLTAAVAAWQPMAEDGSGDIAGLNLDEDISASAAPHPMARGGETPSNGVFAYGYQNAEIESILTRAGYAVAVASTPYGQTLVTGSYDKPARMGDVQPRQPLGPPLPGNTNELTVIGFTPGGRLMATGPRDGTVRFWSITPDRAGRRGVRGRGPVADRR